MSTLKEALLEVLTHPLATMPLRGMLRERAAVFMLHRFEDRERGVAGHDPAEIRATLGMLRRERRLILSLEALFTRLENGEPLDGAIVFTIDDGYLEQSEIAAPLFAEFDCPVTTFVTSGFLDRQLWFWWDQIEHVFLESRRPDIAVRLGGEALAYRRAGTIEREQAIFDFTERCKVVPNAEKLAAITRLAEGADVTLPASAPKRYSPMSWEQLAASERLGMTFGPHTVTHPILSQTDDAQSRFEILESWRRLAAHAAHPVNVYCYPNGQATDFGPREYALLREAGMRGAVVGSRGYAGIAAFRRDVDSPFRVRRFPYPDSRAQTRQVTTGLELVKTRFRGAEPWV